MKLRETGHITYPAIYCGMGVVFSYVLIQALHISSGAATVAHIIAGLFFGAAGFYFGFIQQQQLAKTFGEKKESKNR